MASGDQVEMGVYNALLPTATVSRCSSQAKHMDVASEVEVSEIVIRLDLP